MTRNRLDDFIKRGKGAPGVEPPNKKIRDISRLVVVNSDNFSVSSSIEQVCSHRVQGFQDSRIRVKMKLPAAPLAGFPFHSNKLQGIQVKANKNFIH